MKRAFAFRATVQLVVVALLGFGGAFAQSPSSLPSPSTPPPTEPTLDDLLGLTPAPVAPPADPAKDPAKDEPAPAAKPSDAPASVPGTTDLDRKLAGDTEGDDFTQAVAMMGDAARRLRDSQDPGLVTQRLQEDALKSLDKLISDAQKKQQQSKSQKQSQKKPQPQDSSQSQHQKSQQKQSQPASQSAQKGEPQVPRADGPGRTRAGNTAAWGDLPARVRDSLVEGINDRFSARYRQKTEEYYKRLAEDKKAEGGIR